MGSQTFSIIYAYSIQEYSVCINHVIVHPTKFAESCATVSLEYV